MARGFMEKEENLNKTSYKLMLLILKVLPIICSLGYCTNIILSYFDIDISWIGYIVHVSLIPLIFIYIASIVFKFCAYYKAFIYYIGINEILNILDYNGPLPLSDKELFLLNMFILALLLFTLLYIHVKNSKKTFSKSNR